MFSTPKCLCLLFLINSSHHGINIFFFFLLPIIIPLDVFLLLRVLINGVKFLLTSLLTSLPSRPFSCPFPPLPPFEAGLCAPAQEEQEVDGFDADEPFEDEEALEEDFAA